VTSGRGLAGPALLGVCAAFAWPAAAAADVKACLDAAEEGQRLRDSGAYRDARQRFIACAADECPGEVRKGCVGWLGEMDKLTPTVVFGARAHGKEISDVRVSVDGEVRADRIDGKPVALDPGEHHFRFELAGETDIDQSAVVMAGDKERLITVQFGVDLPPLPPPPLAIPAEPRAAPDVPHEEATRAPAYTLGALGLASLAAGAVLDLSGYVFLQQCNSDPTCPGGHERAEVEWRFVTGDLLLGAGVISSVAAWALWPRRARDGGRPTATIDPSVRSVTLGWRGAF